jgi:hypothetical protein
MPIFMLQGSIIAGGDGVGGAWASSSAGLDRYRLIQIPIDVYQISCSLRRGRGLRGRTPGAGIRFVSTLSFAPCRSDPAGAAI